MSAAATTRSSWTASRALLLPLAPRPVPAGSDPAPFSMPLGFTSGRPFTPLSVATSAFSPATACFRASFSASSRSAKASSSPRGRLERGTFAGADMPGKGRVRASPAQPRQLTSARPFAPAESDVKCNIPGRCGNALAANGNPGWRHVGRDASGVGGTGTAGGLAGRGAEPAGDRAGARSGGLDDQPRAAAQRAAQGGLPAGARRGLLPRAAAAARGPGARRTAQPLRARAPAGRLDAGADRRLAEARRGAGARSGVGRDDLRLHRPGQKGEKLWRLLPRG